MAYILAHFLAYENYYWDSSFNSGQQRYSANIESFNRQFQIGEKEREGVKLGWEQEMGKTMFHVVNAYTRGAQFEGLSAEASYRLQKVGGAILGMVK